MKKDAHYWDFPAKFEAELQKRNLKSGRFNVAVAA
jgi:hypothetical protein